MNRLVPDIEGADHVIGERNAPIVLVEYGDFQCPYCGAAYPELKAVQEALGARLCFVYRNFPLTGVHPDALNAAMFAEAAATIDRFWGMHDLLFENQSALEVENLTGYGRSLGFTDELVGSAMRQEYAPKVRRDFRSGVRSGVNGTPTLFINGARYDGAVRASSLVALLNRI